MHSSPVLFLNSSSHLTASKASLIEVKSAFDQSGTTEKSEMGFHRSGKIRDYFFPVLDFKRESRSIFRLFLILSKNRYQIYSVLDFEQESRSNYPVLDFEQESRIEMYFGYISRFKN